MRELSIIPLFSGSVMDAPKAVPVRLHSLTIGAPEFWFWKCETILNSFRFSESVPNSPLSCLILFSIPFCAEQRPSFTHVRAAVRRTVEPVTSLKWARVHVIFVLPGDKRARMLIHGVEDRSVIRRRRPWSQVSPRRIADGFSFRLDLLSKFSASLTSLYDVNVIALSVQITSVIN